MSCFLKQNIPGKDRQVFPPGTCHTSEGTETNPKHVRSKKTHGLVEIRKIAILEDYKNPITESEC